MYREVCSVEDDFGQAVVIAVEFGNLDEPVNLQLMKNQRDVGDLFPFQVTRRQDTSLQARANNLVLNIVYAKDMPDISEFPVILIVVE